MPSQQRCNGEIMTKYEQSEHRERMLVAAGTLILEQGLEGLTAGKLAARVGLRRTAIHYHFGTMDELIAAMIRHAATRLRETVLERLDPDTVGEAIWTFYRQDLRANEAIRARALVSPSQRLGARH